MFRENLTPELLVRMQIDRCSETSAWEDKTIFNDNVMQLMRLLPSNKREELEVDSELYTVRTTEYIYMKFAGKNLGTVENPYKDDSGNVLSPIPVETEYIDHNELFKLCLVKLEEAGLMWRLNSVMVDGGRVEEEDIIIERTPTFDEEVEEA